MSHWSIDNAGPDALIIRFGDEINPTLVPLIRAATARLAKGLQGQRKAIRDLVPSYTTLMVCYDPVLNDFDSMSRQIKQLLSGVERITLESDDGNAGRVVEIPVWYDLEVGPDLARIAQRHRLSIDEVIQRHSQCEYLVFALGFAPGFAYLGNVDETIATPRLPTPRQRVPAGSVALADNQTAVYPTATPGGWNVIGRTAVKMFDPQLDGLCPLVSGDRVRFVPVSREQFIAAGGVV